MRNSLILSIFLLLIFFAASCGNGSDDPGDGDLDTEQQETTEESDLSTDGDLSETDTDGDLTEEANENETDTESDGDNEIEEETEPEEEWEFDRSNYDLVNGWILLDNDKQAVLDAIDLAKEYGVNHIQLSHNLIMNIDDLFGDPPASNIETLNAAIDKAHGYGMKTYVWAHELPASYITVCYDPEDPSWQTRKDLYKQAFTTLPNLDGIILMYGSSGASPWYTYCTCDWCSENYPGLAIDSPPPDVKVQLVTERVGETVVNELNKEMFVRTFVHSPNELTFHGDGLTNTKGVEFTGMHKGPVQDWQPYNPHHANTGHIGNHPSVLELDIAGEYYGRSILPWCAPGYYRYRLNYAWNNKGIGTVMRISRGSDTAIGTPNEINIKALTELMQDMRKPLENIWDDFIKEKYGLTTDNEGQATLKQILKNTFPIRRKSHYVLGIWALEKSSDIPDDYSFDMIKDDRGYMPHWDEDWTDRWNKVDSPDENVVKEIWQESSEAVELAHQSLLDFESLKDKLTTEIYDDLYKRMLHQYYAARTWRAVKLFMWSKRARGTATAKIITIFDGYMFWAYNELGSVASDMSADELDSVAIASPARINTFRQAVEADVTAKDPVEPDKALFSALEISNVTETSADLAFTPSQAVHVYLDYGTEIPDYGSTLDLGELNADEKHSFSLTGLPQGERVVVRLRAEVNSVTYYGGDFWIFTNFSTK